jgi:ABC-type branched-subunit amino acid transport system substrate-binding protein
MKRVKNMRIIFTLFAAIACMIIAPLNSHGEVVIGWIGPLTGSSAVLGVDSVAVARAAFDEVSARGGVAGHKVRFIAEDDQYVTSKTVSAYSRLVAVERAKIIFVLTYGGIKAIASRAERDGVVLIDPLDCDDDLAALPPNTFCIAKRTEDLGIGNAVHAANKQLSPASIIYFEGDPFPVKVAEATKRHLETAGVSVALFAGVAPGASTDFRALLTSTRTRSARSLFVYGYDDFGLALKQAKELGINCGVYSVPGAGVGSPGFDGAAGAAAEGVLASGWFAPRTVRYQSFRDEYKNKVGRYPFLDVSTIPTFDASRLIIQGLEGSFDKTEGTFSLPQFRNFMLGVRDYDGLSGRISIEQDGSVRSLKTGMYTYTKGEFVSMEQDAS